MLVEDGTVEIIDMSLGEQGMRKPDAVFGANSQGYGQDEVVQGLNNQGAFFGKGEGDGGV